MLAGIPTLSAQTKKEKKEQKKEAVRQLIVSEVYKRQCADVLYL